MREHEFKWEVERRPVDDSTSFVIESDSVDLDRMEREILRRIEERLSKRFEKLTIEISVKRQELNGFLIIMYRLGLVHRSWRET